jgi:single-strand DNA-binding protein
MRQDNTPATSVEIDAYSVGHDLTWGTTTLARVARAQVDQSDRLSDAEVQSAHAQLEGYAEVAEDDGDADGVVADLRATGPLDAGTHPYEVEAEPSGVVPRERERDLTSP